MNYKYKQGIERKQMFFTSFDNLVDENSVARVIDAFVNSIDISKFKYANLDNHVGNSPYNPRTLLKIYLLGYFNKIRSSRKLEKALLVNLEFIWISNGLKIKHTTIADFRKDNHKLLKRVMIDFNLCLKDFNLISNLDSTDGTKVKAVNSKDKNFTLNKIDDRIIRIEKEIDDFEEKFDKEETLDDEKETLLNQIEKYKAKLDNFRNIQKQLENNNQSQISFTDSESKLMKNNGKFEVSYNNQVCVDMKSHIIKDFQLTNNPADLGSMNSISTEVKDFYQQDIVTNVTDKGYDSKEDMMNCLENGIIPEVTPKKGVNEFILETNYEENNITDDEKASTNKDDLRKCLRAGIIPEVYKDKISSIEIVEKNITLDDSNDIMIDDNMTADDKRNFAINNHCFVRDISSNKVFCPMGEIMRKKSINDGKIRYCNKLACKNCKNPCCSSKFKTVDFSKNQIIVGSKKKTNTTRRKKVKTKKVVIKINCNHELLKQRMATSEHPHAQLKFWDDSRYLLLKGIEKGTGELSLYYCAYNIRRSINLLGASKLIDYFNNKSTSSNTSFFNIFYFFLFNFMKTEFSS